MAKKPIIRLKNVTKTYRMGNVDVNAVKGVSLDISQGEFVAVTGPSGSGKSTLMNMIGCLDYPTKGNIYLDGQDISTLEESDLAQIRGKKIGFVFQTFNLIPILSAVENVSLPMIFQGVPKEKRLKRAAELLKIVGLKERIHHKPNELSGGEMQRVAIARSLANDPEVILADEPTGNLDSANGKIIMETLRNLNKKEKKTIIMVTHDQNLMKYAKRIIRIRDGQIAK